MASYIFRDATDGVWKSNKLIKDDPAKYSESLISYLNKFDKLFSKALQTNEFEFICTLITVRGHQDVGWEPFENLEILNKSFKDLIAGGTKENIKANYGLFLYGLILEASLPYETFANLLNIIEGDRYQSKPNFPDVTNQNGRSIPMHPLTKIDQLKSRAKKQSINIDIFDEFFDKDLRNAVFHSDFAVHWPEVRIAHPIKSYKHEEWMLLINKAMAYLDAFLGVRSFYVETYNKPKLITPHPDSGYATGGQMITIIRKKHGVIGLKDNWSEEQLQKGRIPVWFGTFHPYELDLLKKGIIEMPPSKVDSFNKLIKYVHTSWLRGILVKRFRKTHKI